MEKNFSLLEMLLKKKLEYVFSFKRYWCFCIMQIRKVMRSLGLQPKSKYRINNISGNIEAVFFQLGTITVDQHKIKKKYSDASIT